MFASMLRATALLCALALPAFAEDAPIVIEDAYARTAGHHAKSGAVFFMLKNIGSEDDTLLAAASDVAARVELHTHVINAEGVARMVEIKDGISVPAGGEHELKRGADHVMLMGLNGPLENGSSIDVTLTFANAGEIVVQVPVDSSR